MLAAGKVHVFTAIAFMAVICSAGLIQTMAEIRLGERPSVLDLFARIPSKKNLLAFENNLKEKSAVGNVLRPIVQYLQFVVLGNAGEKALAGRDGWLFYRPSYEYITMRKSNHAPNDVPTDPFPAIVSFRDQLRARGIHLLVVPVPNKGSIYPEMLSSRADDSKVIVCRRTRRLLKQLQGAGIDVLNLFEVFQQAKNARSKASVGNLYMPQDTHWSPDGLQLAAEAVALHVVEQGYLHYGEVDYKRQSAPIRHVGDILEMMQVPQLEKHLGLEYFACEQIVTTNEEALYQDDPNSQILVLGDSFLRVFEQDEPRAAGFVAHLARELKQPLMSVINDGGGSTLVRQELARRPKLLENKRLVIWEFVERDIRFGTEGWQEIDLDL